MKHQPTPDLAPAEFLHERDKQLHLSPEVMHTVDYLRQNGEKIPNDPAEKIAAHLDFLRSTVNDGILTGDEASVNRQIESAIVAHEDVPEAYFEFRKRIFREQGHGDAALGPGQRREIVEIDRNDQTERLEEWASYLTSEDALYPDWFRHYSWNSLLKLKPLNQDTREFDKRSRGTTAMFPELDAEALSYVYDALRDKLDGKPGPSDDQDLQKVTASANFAKLYAHALRQVNQRSPELDAQVSGSWTKYDRTDDPEVAEQLAGSLRGRGTGWCTAGKSMAARQLQAGDFYVFYSTDKYGQPTAPRVAIRMHHDKVVEVRGVLPGQQLEPALIGTAFDKALELPGGEAYRQIAEDMKHLTKIDNRLSADPDSMLSDEDLRFLYEIDKEIEGFGYRHDPRIAEILKSRDQAADLGQIFEPTTNEMVVQLLQSREVPAKTLNYIFKALDELPNVNKDSLLSDLIASEGTHLRPEDLIRIFGIDPNELARRIVHEGKWDMQSRLLIDLRYGGIEGLDSAAAVLEFAKASRPMPTVLEDQKLMAMLTSGQRNDVAESLMATNMDYYLARGLDNFPEVDRKKLADHMLATEQASIAVHFIDELPGMNTQLLTKQLLEQPDLNPYELISAVKKLSELSYQAVGQALMERGEYTTLLSEVYRFPDLIEEPITFLTHMIEHGAANTAINIISGYGSNHFPAFDKKAVADQLVRDGQADFVSQYQYGFGLTHDELDEMIMATLPKRKQLAKRVGRFLIGA